MLYKLKETRKNSESGFTLIEILVVVLVIGILAAIAIPVFLNQRQVANDAAVESDAKAVATMVETWMLENPNEPVPWNTGWNRNVIYIGEGANRMSTPLSPGVVMLYRTPDSQIGPGTHLGPSANPEIGVFEIEGAHDNGKQYLAEPVSKRYYYHSKLGGDNSGKTW